MVLIALYTFYPESVVVHQFKSWTEFSLAFLDSWANLTAMSIGLLLFQWNCKIWYQNIRHYLEK